MSGHCQSCGTYHEEDDGRLCASCRYGGVTPSKDDACEIARLRAEVEDWKQASTLNGEAMTGFQARAIAAEAKVERLECYAKIADAEIKAHRNEYEMCGASCSDAVRSAIAATEAARAARGGRG